MFTKRAIFISGLGGGDWSSECMKCVYTFVMCVCALSVSFFVAQNHATFPQGCFSLCIYFPSFPFDRKFPLLPRAIPLPFFSALCRIVSVVSSFFFFLPLLFSSNFRLFFFLNSFSSSGTLSAILEKNTDVSSFNDSLMLSSFFFFFFFERKKKTISVTMIFFLVTRHKLLGMETAISESIRCVIVNDMSLKNKNGVLLERLRRSSLTHWLCWQMAISTNGASALSFSATPGIIRICGTLWYVVRIGVNVRDSLHETGVLIIN